ncbi:amino acid adenylation domain-containing protein [Frankia sp. Ag45/Mut15]|uniref:Amino acid adenylation domain-containing protein n=1 Tax=Frankia umida TaxID=573489 RepID=A0ABT0K2V0_9ACTN|nr:non-ribosomal peptide synthetase [Frankia umida]MCK9877839.1 amino acid adenylation domain-containing protein [Frankia umida]
MTTDLTAIPAADRPGEQPHHAGHQQGLIELIARQVRMRPAAVAVESEHERCSYAELDARANRLAHRLQALGAGPDRLVAIYAERSVHLVVSLLAIWRAGAGYLPLDPAHPAGRTRYQLADSRAPIVLTDSASAAELAAIAATAGVDSDVVVMDRLDLPAEPTSSPPLPDWPDRLAYAIYTSGSTGQPKGVLISHAGIANRVCWAVEALQLTAADRVLQKTGLSFDAAGWEIFAPLIIGGTVVLAPPGAERDPAALVRAIGQRAATVLQVVPSVLRLLVAEPGWSGLTSLRVLCSAGEALQAELVDTATASLPARPAVWNTYGPTECSIDVTAALAEPGQARGSVPIGRSLPGIRIFLLDEEGLPVPIGVPGELQVSGIGLARGYLGRPELTAERFLPNPYGQPGDRLYRTGDLARWRADGSLEYRGRIDQQIKVNGVRIEPAEIEATLLAHPQVTGALVSSTTTDSGDTRLVGYVVIAGASGDPVPVPADLPAFLRDRLPEAMVPGILLGLAAFTLLPNGKIDRQALPWPGGAGDGRRPYLAPRTAGEQAVTEIWSQLLGVDRIGVYDDFFQLGGTSLHLTRLASRLRAASAGGEIPLRGLFTAATVQAQAELLGSAPADRPVLALPAGQQPPLSFGQQRLWFLDRLDPGGAEWVSPLFLKLPEPAEGAAEPIVQAALDALELRHESLRTRYLPSPTAGSDPVPVIAPAGRVELTVADTDRDGLASHIGAQLARGFDLETGPIWRALLVRVAGERPLVLVSMHHIACDGWSSAILEREFAQLCQGLHDGVPAQLPPLALRYADFAAWQRQHLTEAELAPDLASAREQLAGLQPLPLPTDRPRGAERDHRGAVHAFSLPPALTAGVEALGRRHAATPFITLLTGFAALLARYTQHWDVPIGTPVAGRIRPETENLVGFFLNSLVLRCRLHAEQSFTAALEQVRIMATETFSHQNLPFERLVDEVGGERALSRTPLYQVAFDLHDDQLTSSGADLEDLGTFAAAWRIAKTDLTLFMRRRPDGSMLAMFEYATSLFDPSTVQGLAEHFVRLLTAAVADPACRLAELPVLDPAAEHRQLVEWNRTEPQPAGPATVLAAIEAQARSRPAAIALRAGAASMTFADLDARADQLGRLLLAQGAPSLVAVLAERGVQQLVGFLGCWKAGAGYVPLEASQPRERTMAILAEAGIRVVLTTARLADQLRDFPGTVLRLDEPPSAPPAPLPGASPSEVAYVIFTSGSTGVPKGVVVTHDGLVNHLSWAARTLAGRGQGGSALFSSAAFDLVVSTIYAPLMAGQTVHLAPPDLPLDRLGGWLVEQGPYSFLKLTPGHLEILTAQLTDQQARELAEVVLVAGEALPAALAGRWLALLGPGRLVNEYGPTECTVGASTFAIDAPSPTPVVPIGRPLPGLRMYVLDGELRPSPVGAVGELYIAGPGVARGYLHRPDLTAERFLPDPYGPPGTRRYRSGDLVRQLPDGAVCFLGRADLQVKVRGFRVELDEIRLALASHPAIAEVCVLSDSAVAVRILAGYVPTPGQSPAESELRAYCRDRLPDYMVPAAFVELAAIPLNQNGKVDRVGLLARLTRGAGAAGAADRAPRTDAELRVAARWAELLGREVGVHENFFTAGGNSILTIRLMSLLQQDFDVSLDIRIIFAGPTVAHLAQSIEDRIRDEIDQLSDEQVADELASKDQNA